MSFLLFAKSSNNFNVYFAIEGRSTRLLNPGHISKNSSAIPALPIGINWVDARLFGKPPFNFFGLAATISLNLEKAVMPENSLVIL